MPAISADSRSILGQQWRWRGGNMDLTTEDGASVAGGIGQTPFFAYALVWEIGFSLAALIALRKR